VRKISIILILGVLIGGCSMTRKVGHNITDDSNKLPAANVLERVKELNISNRSFFIQKAEIEVVNKSVKEKFIGSIKFEKPDKYLISLKSRAGIEVARVYITKDTIWINDRMNRKLYYGNALYFEKKYGLNQKFLPLIFGDIVLERKIAEDMKECSGDKLAINCFVNGVILNYELDCKKRKTIFVNQVNNFAEEGIKIRYEKFSILEDILIPKNVKIEDSQYNTEINIKFLKIELPWNGSIKFVSGKGYELIELV
jgi:hypothetical protein